MVESLYVAAVALRVEAAGVERYCPSARGHAVVVVGSSAVAGVGLMTADLSVVAKGADLFAMAFAVGWASAAAVEAFAACRPLWGVHSFDFAVRRVVESLYVAAVALRVEAAGVERYCPSIRHQVASAALIVASLVRVCHFVVEQA